MQSCLPHLQPKDRHTDSTTAASLRGKLTAAGSCTELTMEASNTLLVSSNLCKLLQPGSILTLFPRLTGTPCCLMRRIRSAALLSLARDSSRFGSTVWTPACCIMPAGARPGGGGGIMPGGTMPPGAMPGGIMPPGTVPGGTIMPACIMPGGIMACIPVIAAVLVAAVSVAVSVAVGCICKCKSKCEVQKRQ
jgi:hypothetical protein